MSRGESRGGTPPPWLVNIGDGTERVGIPPHHESPPRPENRDDVVAQLRLRMSRRVLIAQPDHPFPLRARNRLMTFAGASRLPRLHLRDHDRPPAPRDQINLTR